jgi:hypothetical protein
MRSIFLILLLFSASIAEAQLEFKASVEPTAARVGEQVKLLLVAKGAASGVQTPVMPSLSGLELVGGPFRSTELQVINGRMTGSTTYTYVLRASNPGTGKIGPSTLTFKGKQFATQPIEIQITDAGEPAKPTAPKGQSEDVFIRARTDKKKTYQNDRVILTYSIYFRSSITSPEIIRLPRTAGFWAEEVPLPRDLPVREEVVGGVQYRVAVFKQMALFPTQTGKLTVEPLALRIQVEVKSRRRDPFGLFDDPYFGMGRRTETREIQSPGVSIDVDPLPLDGQPSNFGGAVGDFSVEANLDKTAVQAHEAVTLTFRISGEGNIKTLADPVPEPKNFFPPDLESYDPKVSEDIHREGGNIRGSKTFEYLLIPRAAGIQNIPSISYSFFNPKSKRYYTLSTPALALQVEKGTETGRSSGVPMALKRGVEQIGEDIAYIKVKPGAFHHRGIAPYEEVTFWIALVVPWGVVAAVVAERRRRDKLAGTPLRLRNLRAPKQARKGLANARKLLGRSDGEVFYGAITHTLRDYLAGRLNQSADDFTMSELEAAWNERAWPPEILEEARGILDECDFARFASGNLPTARRDDILCETEQIIEVVERIVAAEGKKK